jgi:hypothetical protein
VPEGSSPDPAQPSVETEATPPAAAAEEVTEEERTPAEIETIWKNRVAGKDRAHAAAEQALRGQIEELNRQLTGKQVTDQATMSDVEREKARADAAEQRAVAAENQRSLDLRTIKYAAAAELLSDDPTFATMDEAKLAALNARLTSEGEPAAPPRVDPNSAPKRSSTPPSPLRGKSVEELEADLKKYEPEFIQQIDQ